MWPRLKDASQSPYSGRYYLCCGSCLRPGPAPILGNRSISLWSCTAHTPGCTLGDGYSSLPPHRSCCWSLGEAPGDKNTRLLSPVPRYTGDCSRPGPQDTDLWREVRNVTGGYKHNKLYGGTLCTERWFQCPEPYMKVVARMLIRTIGPVTVPSWGNKLTSWRKCKESCEGPQWSQWVQPQYHSPRGYIRNLNKPLHLSKNNRKQCSNRGKVTGAWAKYIKNIK